MKKAKASPLPIVGAKTPIAKSRMGKRRAAVLIGVHLIAAAHIAHWRMTGSSLTPVEPSEAMEFAKHSVVNAGLIFFAATILLTAVFGRFFCGWACHIVALQDLCRWLLLKVGIRPKPFRSRLLRWVPLAAFVYMFLWPVAYRLWIGDSFLPIRAETTTADFWATFPGWPLALATFLICGFVVVYFLGAKGFCTYGCPYGGIFGVVDKVAPMAIRVTDDCEGCAHCTATCSSNVRVHEEVATYGRVVDSGCMKCLDCVDVCPKDALYLGFGAPSFATPERAGAKQHRMDLSWGEEALVATAFVAALSTFRGLYDLFPFLLSLGFAALLAYLTLQAARLVTRENLRIRSFSLKRSGKLLTSGWVFSVLFLVLGTLWVHSGYVRYHQFRGARVYASIVPLTAATIERGSAPTLSGEARDRVESALGHLDRVDRFALRDSSQLEIQIAWLHQLAGRPAAFRAYSETALQAAPQNVTMRLELADFYFNQGNGESAKTFYREVLALDPSITKAALNLGTLEAQGGNLDIARAIFEAGLRENSESSPLLYNLGLVNLAKGDIQEAIQRLEGALAIDPGYLEARENLAGVLSSLGRFDEGLEHYRTAIEQSPNDPSTRMLAARAYVGIGNLEAAEREVRKALELQPSLPGGREFLEALSR